MLDPFVVQKQQQQKRNKNFPFSALISNKGLTGTLHMVSEQEVKMIGPDGLIDMQVCCELCNLTM